MAGLRSALEEAQKNHVAVGHFNVADFVSRPPASGNRTPPALQSAHLNCPACRTMEKESFCFHACCYAAFPSTRRHFAR